MSNNNTPTYEVVDYESLNKFLLGTLKSIRKNLQIIIIIPPYYLHYYPFFYNSGLNQDYY